MQIPCSMPETTAALPPSRKLIRSFLFSSFSDNETVHNVKVRVSALDSILVTQRVEMVAGLAGCWCHISGPTSS